MTEEKRERDARLAPGAGSEHDAAWTAGGFSMCAAVPMADGSFRDIEFISPGNLVAAYCEASGRIEARLVLKTFEYMRPLCKVEVEGRTAGSWNLGMHACKDQLVWVEPAGWTRVADLKPGDLMRFHDGWLTPVVSVGEPGAPEIVSGIVVDGAHTYFADWLRVHDGYRPEEDRTFTEPGSGAMFARHVGPHPEHAALTRADALCMLASVKKWWFGHCPGQENLPEEAAATLFDGITVEVARLEGNALASSSGNTITLSDSAAGWGWYISHLLAKHYAADGTRSEERFDQSYYSDVPYFGGDPAGTRIDLLVVLMLQLREVVTRRHAMEQR